MSQFKVGDKVFIFRPRTEIGASIFNYVTVPVGVYTITKIKQQKHRIMYTFDVKCDEIPQLNFLTPCYNVCGLDNKLVKILYGVSDEK